MAFPPLSVSKPRVHRKLPSGASFTIAHPPGPRSRAIQFCPGPARVPPHPDEGVLAGSRVTTGTAGPPRPPGFHEPQSEPCYDVVLQDERELDK
jgi:hypothetical protein